MEKVDLNQLFKPGIRKSGDYLKIERKSITF